MKLFKLFLLFLTIPMISHAWHRHYHRPVFGFQVGYPVATVMVQPMPYYVRPCRVIRPIVYPMPYVRPHVGFAFGSGPFSFGFSL